MSESSRDARESEDFELIAAYLRGDSGAFDVLYDRYQRPLYAYLNHLLRDSGTAADDLFQRTWLKALDKLPGYRHQEKFSAWLMRIARNLAIDQFRSAARHGELSADELEDESLGAKTGDSPWDRLDNRELAAAIDQAVAALPPTLREVFELRREEVPFREIAVLQKCSLNTCLARMQYALKRLRLSLRTWDPAGGEDQAPRR